MAQHADPNKAYVWLTGEGYRGAPNAEMPADPFAETLAGWKAYGGIEAGFEITAEQSVNKLKVFNYRQAAYKVTRDPVDNGVKFRAVDNTEAAVLTRLQGGKITKKGNLYIATQGIGEEFSFLMTLDDGDDKMAMYYPLVTLSAPATRANIDGQTLDSYEFTLTALKPPQEVMVALPDGMTIP